MADPGGRSRRSVLLSLFLYAVGFAGVAVVLLAPDEPALRGGRWFYASLALHLTTYEMSMVGYALCAGTFGSRHEPQGKMLQTVAALGVIPAGILLFAAIGYMVFGATGAVVA